MSPGLSGGCRVSTSAGVDDPFLHCVERCERNAVGDVASPSAPAAPCPHINGSARVASTERSAIEHMSSGPILDRHAYRPHKPSAINDAWRVLTRLVQSVTSGPSRLPDIARRLRVLVGRRARVMCARASVGWQDRGGPVWIPRDRRDGRWLDRPASCVLAGVRAFQAPLRMRRTRWCAAPTAQALLE